MTEAARALEAVHVAIKELRSEVELNKPNEEKVLKLETALDEFETKNAEVVTQIQEARAATEEQKERIAELEVAIAKSSSQAGKADYKETAEYKALDALCKKGEILMPEEHKQLLRTDSDVSGGFLVIPEMDSQLTRKIVEISAIRSIARVRSIASKSLIVPVRASILAAQYEGEAETDTDDTSTYSSETLTPFRQSVTVPITKDMLMDASFDMESEIMLDAGEAFAQGEGAGFVAGSGFKQPKGFLSDARITDNARQSTNSSVLDADDILLVTGDLKTGYNAMFVLNRRTIATLRTQKSTTGQYLWAPGINGVVSSTLAGEPYLIANDMPDIADNAFPVAFGDFFRGYTIIDRMGLVVVRDELTRKKFAIIEFTIHRWNTGQVTLPEAITVIQIKP